MAFLDLSDARWLAFSSAQPGVSIFHHPAWARLLADCYGFRPFVVAVLDRSKQVCAGLPIMEVRGLSPGRRWVSLPFTDHLAPLHVCPEGLTLLGDSLIGLSRSQNGPQIQLRWEFPAHGGAIQPYSNQVLHTLPLESDYSSVLRGLSTMHRRNVKIAERRGVRIVQGTQPEHLEAFYCLHLQTRRRQGVPIQPRKFFELLRKQLLDQDLGFVMLAYADTRCLAAAVFLHWQHTLTYKYGASDQDGLELRPNNLLFWSAIRWGCEQGYTLFDMGRTDLVNTGLRAFKSGWGAAEMPLTYSTLPVQSSRPRSARLMRMMETVIRKSPPFVCRTVGELLYRFVG